MKFVLLTFSRSGSSVFADALGEHPDISMYGELFHDEQEERPRVPPRGLQYDDTMNGAHFLTRHVFTGRAGHAVGFKLFYFHARSSRPSRRVWDYLTTHRDVHIVHLTRENLLECALSHLLAERTGRWRRRLHEPAQQDGPFTVDIDWLSGFFDMLTAWRLWADQTFGRHPLLRLGYESHLCTNFAEAVRTTHRFLGVEPQRTRPGLAKINLSSPRELILNYDAVAEHFQHTLFARFFE